MWFTRSRELSVRIASCEAERSALIRLRTTVYRDAGKHRRAQPMQDIFDDGAIHVGVWRGASPIACARILCRDPADEWEHDRFMAWSDLLPARAECCEVSRFCVVHAERQWAVIRLLCHGVLVGMVQTGRPYFVACCTDELVRFYRVFMGARLSGQVIQHADLGTKPHHVFSCDYSAVLFGRRLHLGPWLMLWPRVALRMRASLRGRLPVQRRGWLAFLAGYCLEPVAWRVYAFVRARQKLSSRLRPLPRIGNTVQSTRLRNREESAS